MWLAFHYCESNLGVGQFLLTTKAIKASKKTLQNLVFDAGFISDNDFCFALGFSSACNCASVT